MNTSLSNASNSKTSYTSQLSLKNPYIFALLLGVFALTLFRVFVPKTLHSPPPLVEVEPWELTNQHAQPFGTAQMKGRVWVADFFFTRCPTICAELTRTMSKVKKNLTRHGNKVGYLSFSVDPEFDTPPRLKSYIEKHQLDDSSWSFLTSDSRETMKRVVTEQIKMVMGMPEALPKDPSLLDISHSAKLVLFDEKGDLRAVFGTDNESLVALGHATQQLVRELNHKTK